MMKIRGWLLIAAMTLGAQFAAASDSNDLARAIRGGTAAEQQAVVDSLAGVVGADVAQTQLVESSRGTLLPALAAVPAGNVKDALDALLPVATAVGGEGALSVISGTYATAGTDAASATTSAVGGGGGVIAGRQAGLMAERKALGNVDSALASFKMNQNFANRVWASPFYTRQNMDGQDGYAGYDYSAWGASVGYDHAFGAFTAGGAFTYSTGDFDADGISDDNTMDNYSFSLYGQYYNTANGVFGTLAGGYSYGDNSMDATINGDRITGDNDSDSYWFGANVGKDFFIGENWTVTPTVGLFWSQTEGSAYTSRFNGAAFQSFDKMDSESVLLPIDLKVEYTTMLDESSSLSFTVTGGYAYNMKSDGGRADGSFNYVGSGQTVFIQGVEPGRNSWNIGAGVTYRRDNFDIGVNYRYDGKADFDGHRVAATVGWNF